MCLNTKGERACAQMKHFKRIYQSISKSISTWLLWHLHTLANNNKELHCYLNFPSTSIFCSLLYMSFWLSELPVPFDKKHSQLLKTGRVFNYTW